MEPEESAVDPQVLAEQAAKEPSRRGLSDYAQAILLLKDEKGFSFREIASWLGERGVKTDHNAVWRAYARMDRPTISRGYIEQNEQSEQSAGSNGAMTWM